MKKQFIPIYEPYKAKNQRKYVMDCINSNWISSRGEYIDKFEKTLANYIGVKHVITTFNGSVSLMLILKALNIGYGDYVLVPSLTYAATISAINLVGATAILIDSDNNFQMTTTNINNYCRIKPKAILVPQLYGDAPDMAIIKKYCKSHNIYLIEDSAESFGCKYREKMIGSIGIAASFSFFGNKIITTGEGGCVCTNDNSLAIKMRLLKNQSHIGGFIHDGPGFNFRMTNIQAAIGLAQFEDLNYIVKRKREIAQYYRENLSKDIKKIIPSIYSTEWMPLFSLPKTINYVKFSSLLRNKLIDTRPAFTPIHLMSGFNFVLHGSLKNSESIYKQGFNLPSYPDLTNGQLKYICEEVNAAVEVIE